MIVRSDYSDVNPILLSASQGTAPDDQEDPAVGRLIFNLVSKAFLAHC